MKSPVLDACICKPICKIYGWSIIEDGLTNVLSRSAPHPHLKRTTLRTDRRAPTTTLRSTPIDLTDPNPPG
jgi:hypothetical protein